jgi:hypothetical protein
MLFPAVKQGMIMLHGISFSSLLALFRINHADLLSETPNELTVGVNLLRSQTQNFSFSPI